MTGRMMGTISIPLAWCMFQWNDTISKDRREPEAGRQSYTDRPFIALLLLHLALILVLIPGSGDEDAPAQAIAHDLHDAGIIDAVRRGLGIAGPVLAPILFEAHGFSADALHIFRISTILGCCIGIGHHRGRRPWIASAHYKVWPFWQRTVAAHHEEFAAIHYITPEFHAIFPIVHKGFNMLHCFRG